MPDDRSLLLYFLDETPERCWGDLFAPQGERLDAANLGQVAYAAPFLPTVPGTDRYTDELW